MHPWVNFVHVARASCTLFGPRAQSSAGGCSEAMETGSEAPPTRDVNRRPTVYETAENGVRRTSTDDTAEKPRRENPGAFGKVRPRRTKAKKSNDCDVKCDVCGASWTGSAGGRTLTERLRTAPCRGSLSLCWSDSTSTQNWTATHPRPWCHRTGSPRRPRKTWGSKPLAAYRRRRRKKHSR